jgi:hypothetical protein
MKYEVIPMQKNDHDGSDFIWCVFEKTSQQIIKAYSFEDDADTYCRFLNHGGAFDGSTPSFVLRSVAVKAINHTFEEAFA